MGWCYAGFSLCRGAGARRRDRQPGWWWRQQRDGRCIDRVHGRGAPVRLPLRSRRREKVRLRLVQQNAAQAQADVVPRRGGPAHWQLRAVRVGILPPVPFNWPPTEALHVCGKPAVRSSFHL